jgi:hypothetical protein
MTPTNRRSVHTALAILGVMALVTAAVWTALFLFLMPAKASMSSCASAAPSTALVRRTKTSWSQE